MKTLAEGVAILDGFPPHAINVYLIDGILIDAGTRFAAGRILRQLKGRDVTAHALTHAHPDHQGSSQAVCRALKLPFWCSREDRPAAEDPDLMRRRQPKAIINEIMGRVAAGPGHPVDRELVEGDEVGGFRVVASPGHTIGHLAFWREADRTLILGDVLRNMNFITAGEKLGEPPRVFTIDPAENRRSARKLAALRPELILFGHGRPLRDGARFVDFAAGLPE